MNKLKRSLAVITAAVMSISLFSSCGKRGADMSATDHLFSATTLTIDGGFDNVNDSVYINGNFYILADRTEVEIVPADENGGLGGAMPIRPLRGGRAEMSVVDDTAADTGYIGYDGEIVPPGMTEKYTSYTTLAVVDENGKIINSKDISVNDSSQENNESSRYSSMTVSPDGNMLAVKSTSKNSVDADGNYNYEQTSKIVQLDQSLSETVYFDITAAMKKIPQDQNKDNQTSADTFIIDDSGNVYLSTYSGIYIFDNGGNFLFSILSDNGDDPSSYSFIQGIYKIDGAVAANVIESKNDGQNNSSVSSLKIIDIHTRKYGTSYPFDDGRAGSVFAGNKDYPIIVSDGAEIFSFDYLTGKKTLLIDFLASGLTIDYYNNFMILGPERFAVINTEYGNGMMRAYGVSKPTTTITIFDKVDPATVKPRQVIKVYNYYRDQSFLRFASEFNKNSTEYEIDVKTYNSNYDQTDTALTSLNNDIISGNIPDILLLDPNMPYDSYAAKGLFLDLNTYFDKDPDFSRDKLNTDVLNAFSTNGKLYSIARNYSILGLTGKTSIFGNEPKLTAEKIEAAQAAYPESTLMGQWTQSDFVNLMIGMQINSYIDKKTGKVSFNSPEFIELINTAKTYPTAIDFNNTDYSNYDTMYRDNRALLSYTYISDFRSLINQQYQSFGEEITFMGFPNPTDSGIMISTDLELAIMARGNRDGAWEVLKAYMNSEPEYSYGFTIFNDDIDKLAEEAKKTPTYTDPVTGEVIEQPNTYWFNNESHEYPNNTDADNQKIYDILANTSGVVRTDKELMKIIEEETAAFFAGSKTAEECAKLIQDRASTYVAETR